MQTFKRKEDRNGNPTEEFVEVNDDTISCVRFGTEPYWHQNAYGSSVVDYGFDIMGYLGL